MPTEYSFGTSHLSESERSAVADLTGALDVATKIMRGVQAGHITGGIRHEIDLCEAAILAGRHVLGEDAAPAHTVPRPAE
jgi:hypothetical protein